MLNLKANKKLVKNRLASTTGKAIILKDLSNIRTSVSAGSTRNDLNETVKKLTDKYG